MSEQKPQESAQGAQANVRAGPRNEGVPLDRAQLLARFASSQPVQTGGPSVGPGRLSLDGLAGFNEALAAFDDDLSDFIAIPESSEVPDLIRPTGQTPNQGGSSEEQKEEPGQVVADHEEGQGGIQVYFLSWSNTSTTLPDLLRRFPLLLMDTANVFWSLLSSNSFVLGGLVWAWVDLYIQLYKTLFIGAVNILLHAVAAISRTLEKVLPKSIGQGWLSPPSTEPGGSNANNKPRQD